MDLPEKKSSKSKTVWIVVGVVIALIVLAGSVYAVIMATMPRQESNNDQNTNTQRSVSDEDLRLGLDDLNKTIEQDKTDRENAQKALDDQVNRIKLAN